MALENITTRHEWLTLEPVAGVGWFVNDEGQKVLTGDGVIGQIQFFDGCYEVLQRTDPSARMAFNTLEEAVDCFITSTSDFSSQVRALNVKPRGSLTAAARFDWNGQS